MTRGPGCAGLRGAGTPSPHGGPGPAPLAPGPAAGPVPQRLRRGGAGAAGGERCAGAGEPRGLRPRAARPRGGAPVSPVGFFKFLFTVGRRGKASSSPPPLLSRHPPADPGPALGWSFLHRPLSLSLRWVLGLSVAAAAGAPPGSALTRRPQPLPYRGSGPCRARAPHGGRPVFIIN